MNFNQIVASNI